MLLWKAVTIENCAACHVHSQGLCYMWIHVKRPLNINACPLPDLTTFSKSFLIDMLLIATYRVDLKSFLARGAFFLSREATERATISQVINSDHSPFLGMESSFYRRTKINKYTRRLLKTRRGRLDITLWPYEDYSITQDDSPRMTRWGTIT